MFTDNCSDYDVGSLYKHYTGFALLFHGGWPVVSHRKFRAFAVSQSPMGLHDVEDTESLVEGLATRYQPFYNFSETHTCSMCFRPSGCTGYYELEDSSDRWVEACERCMNPLREQPTALIAMSPIEKSFWGAHLRVSLPALTGLVPQHPVGRYFIDFALPDRKIGIELDGFATHSSTTDITKDRQRQRAIESQGWRIIRFGGQEVHRDPVACVKQAAELAERLAKAT